MITKSFSHMLTLANLAEEVQIAYRRRIKLKNGDFADENSATTESDIEETLKRLVGQLKKSPMDIFDALKNQTVDLVLTAHPTQSVRRSLLQKHGRIRTCLTQLYAKDITPDEKQELDEALQREIFSLLASDVILSGVQQLEPDTQLITLDHDSWASWYNKSASGALLF